MTITKNSAILRHVGERGFLKRLLPRLATSFGPSFLVPPGDDASILKTRSRPVLSIDGLTEGTHFLSTWSDRVSRWSGFSFGRALGWKLMGCCLSDLAAMGDTRHRWAMIYLGAPANLSMKFLNEFQRGTQELAQKYECALAGGDTVKANDLTLVGAVGAELKSSRALTRDGAIVGDFICIAGTVGDARVGLEILQRKQTKLSRSDSAYFIRRFFEHIPLFDEGAALARENGVSSLMDLSDALVDSVEILSERSRVGALIDVGRIPVSSRYRRFFSVDSRLLTAGEDYSLLFTMKPSAVQRLQRKVRFSVIGQVTSKANGVVYSLEGKKVYPKKSFQHFFPK